MHLLQQVTGQPWMSFEFLLQCQILLRRSFLVSNESHFENVDPEHGVGAVGEVIVLVLIGHSEIVLLVTQLLLLQLLCLLNKQVHQKLFLALK